MNIQSNINQTLSLAGLLASQTPMAETARMKASEKRKATEAERQYQKLHNAAAESNASYPTTEADIQVERELFNEIVGASKERYLTNPTPETEEDYSTWLNASKEFEGSILSKQRAAKAKAEEAGRAEQERLAEDRALYEKIFGGQDNGNK